MRGARCLQDQAQVSSGADPHNPRHALPRTQPLVLLTRPRHQAERFARACRASLGDIEIIVSPLVDIEARAPEVALDGVRGLIFTSENGVRAFGDQKAVSGLDAWCVGGRTARVAQAAGYRAWSADGDAEALIRMILAAAPAGPLLHLRGDRAAGDIARRLTAAGVPTREAVIYDQTDRSPSEAARAVLAGERPVILPLFSPRSARRAVAAFGDANAPLWPVAISKATAEAWRNGRAEPVRIAVRPDAAAMLDAMHGIIATDHAS